MKMNADEFYAHAMKLSSNVLRVAKVMIPNFGVMVGMLQQNSN